jgi:plasmid stabilization system protein ParE
LTKVVRRQGQAADQLEKAIEAVDFQAQRLKDDIEVRVSRLPEHPKLYRAGRVAGTREMVVRTNYVVIYAEDSRTVSILRVLHAAQQWPPDQQ